MLFVGLLPLSACAMSASVDFTPDGNEEWRQEHQTIVNVFGLDGDTLESQWSDSEYPSPFEWSDFDCDVGGIFEKQFSTDNDFSAGDGGFTHDEVIVLGNNAIGVESNQRGISESPAMDVSAVGTVAESRIKFEDQGSGPGDQVNVETSVSFDGGDNWGIWYPVESESTIPQLGEDTNLTEDTQLRFRAIINDFHHNFTPELRSVEIEIRSQGRKITSISEGSGDKHLFIRGEESLGETRVFSSERFRLDNDEPPKPDIVFLSPSGYKAGTVSNDDVQVSIESYYEDYSEVDRIEYRLSGAETQGWERFRNSFVISEFGETDVYARVIDNAGNVSEERVKTVIVSGEVYELIDVDLSINDDAETTESENVSLQLNTWTEGVDEEDLEVQFSNNGNTWYGHEDGNWVEDWGAFQSEYDWELLPGSGEKTVYVRVRDDSYDVKRDVAEIYLVEEGDTPGGSSDCDIEIESTDDTKVTLELSDLSNVERAKFSTDGVTWSPWERVSGDSYIKIVTVPPGDGIKTIYTKLQNPYGEIGNMLVKDFYLDTTPPTLNITTGTGSFITVSETISLVLEIKDNISDALEYRIGDGEWTTTTSPVVVENVAVDEGYQLIRVEVKDEAGNTTDKSVHVLRK